MKNSERVLWGQDSLFTSPGYQLTYPTQRQSGLSEFWRGSWLEKDLSISRLNAASFLSFLLSDKVTTRKGKLQKHFSVFCLNTLSMTVIFFTGGCFRSKGSPFVIYCVFLLGSQLEDIRNIRIRKQSYINFHNMRQKWYFNKTS